MKKPIFITLALILSGLILIKQFKLNGQNLTTEISIFSDYIGSKAIGSTAIVEEALKSISVECNHIFLNKMLWNECISDLNKDTFKSIWNVYDTHIGLLYLQHRQAPLLPGMQIDKCTVIEDPFDTYQIATVNENKEWARLFETLFDIGTWQQYHSNPNNRICIYMNGHGMARMDSYDYDIVCGINAKEFAHLLNFFNKELRINLLGVQSCYWTAARISELMKDLYGYTTLYFSILTPLSSEEGLWLDTAHNYIKTEGYKSCFFECCADFTEQYNHQMTDEIKKLVYSTDTLSLELNKNQNATMIAGGTSELVTIARA